MLEYKRGAFARLEQRRLQRKIVLYKVGLIDHVPYSHLLVLEHGPLFVFFFIYCVKNLGFLVRNLHRELTPQGPKLGKGRQWTWEAVCSKSQEYVVTVELLRSETKGLKRTDNFKHLQTDVQCQSFES